MREMLFNWIESWYLFNGKTGIKALLKDETFQSHQLFWSIGLFSAMLLISFLFWWLARTIMLSVVHYLAERSKTPWDDFLVNNKFFKALAHLVPLFFMDYFLSIVFFAYPDIKQFCLRLVDFLIVFAVLISVLRFLNSVRDVLQTKESLKDKPVQSYIQVSKIILSIFFVIVMLSVLFNKSPQFFLTSLGAMTAIIILVFKDTILGFVGSIQLATNDMVRIGDWVTMERYGADGDVIEINLATVKVQNFDKTITTIPTYSFISDSFKNWRGMEESPGRRIKRSILIQIDTVKFAPQEMLERFKEAPIMRGFIEERQAEIKKYNSENGIDPKSIQARKQTNIGLFRAYLVYYLKNNPNVNPEMSLMVRQLEPKEFGVPVEIYCFSKIKDWEQYEMIVADIFDHVFASIHQFELSIYERPSGNDFRKETKPL
ncbi:MAG: mechanosensitive ion channel family protein [Lishizhenia sp.]